MTEPTALARVRALRGVTWDWKDTGTRGMGVIAHDVRAVFLDEVTTDEDGYLRVDYHGLVGALVEAVKELGRPGGGARADRPPWTPHPALTPREPPLCSERRRPPGVSVPPP